MTAGCAVTAGARTRRAYLELEAQPGAVPEVRRWTRSAQAGWGLQPVADDAELIIAELAANAITASGARPFPASVGLLIVADRQRLVVLVWGASPQPPVHQPHDEDSVGGRGLEIADALSDRWEFVHGDQQRGKVTWSLIANRL